MERVVVTGMGAVTPLGNTATESWQAIRENRSGLGPFSRVETTDFEVYVAGEVKDFDPSHVLPRRLIRRMDLFSQYGILAAQEALDQSGFDLEEEPGVGVYVGNGMGGLPALEAGILQMADKGAGRIHPLLMPMVIPNMVAGNISIHLGTRGPAMTMSTACAAGTTAIGEAFLAIRQGRLPAVLAGGVEGVLSTIGVGGFRALTALSHEKDPKLASRPFDRNRDGFVMGEGGGMLFLESLSSAQARGAKIYGEIVGYGANSDAYHMTSPREDGSGAGQAILEALAMADLEVEAVDYINAHGTSTPTNDPAETLAIKYALGDHAYEVAISSTKGHTGHLLGGAGAIEAIFSLQALGDNFVPATLGLEDPDPACDLNYTPGRGIDRHLEVALSNSLGFGGHNAVLAMRSWED